MKLRNAFLFIGFVFSFGAVLAKSVEEVDRSVWFQGVEAVRLNCGHVAPTIRSSLEEYDSTLLRQYFQQFTPRDGATDSKGVVQDMIWKLMGLAMYGTKEDLGEMKRLESTLSSCLLDNYERQILDLAQPALVAREGTDHEIAQALSSLTRSPEWMQMDGLVLSGGWAARDRLLGIVADPRADFHKRTAALSSLDTLDDPRRLDIMLLPDFVGQARMHLSPPDDETFLELVARYTGTPELMKLKTVAALQELVKHGFKLPPREVKKKTVRGGIDWSKYWKQTSISPSKTAPIPGRIRQPKRDKPDAATAPAQKPPASNAGKLIAASAALVGLLAVLFWFLRKK
jgi:hypothetical protein